MPLIRLLIIDDHLDFYRTFRDGHQAAYDFEVSSDADQGLDKIAQNEYDAVLLDLEFSGKYTYEQGLSQLVPEAVKRANQRFPIIVATSDNRISTRQVALQHGAAELFRKADYQVDGWHRAICRIISQFLDQSTSSEPDDGFLATSEVMQQIKNRLQKLVLYQDKPVLITGESGVGKEVAAAFTHACKQQAKLRFEAVNLASLPANLLENEIFGHAKGAFTDAKEEKKGYFETVGAGTLFLDEIGEVSLATQVTLLRVLENREFTPVGSTISQPLRAHLIFGTNKDLDEAVAQKEFREDFYERISTLHIHIPPLRERREEIIPLCRYFLKKLCKPHHAFYGKALEDCFSEELLEVFLRYDWPTNIRQLRNTIDQVLFEADNRERTKADVSLLPERFRRTPQISAAPIMPTSAISAPAASEQWPVEKQNAYNTLQTIEKALIQSLGKKDEAAKLARMENDQNMRYRVKSLLAKYPDFLETSFFAAIIKAYKLQ